MRTGSLINNVLGNTLPAREPMVGDGMTLLHWTDRRACTVVEVSKTGKTIVIQRDKVQRTDTNGMSDAQSYAYEKDPDGATYTVRRGKDGRWKVLGDPGTVVVPGRREHYDYSF